MDKELDPRSGDYTGNTIDTLKNAVYIRLATPLGSWWADTSVGSLLHLLQREKDLERVALLAEQMQPKHCNRLSTMAVPSASA